jgi:hypothetical protein
MYISNHVIQRFRERITSESFDVVRIFIESDIKNSQFLYRINDIEKRIINGIIYVLDYKETTPTVVTLYLDERFRNENNNNIRTI